MRGGLVYMPRLETRGGLVLVLWLPLASSFIIEHLTSETYSTRRHIVGYDGNWSGWLMVKG